MRQLCWVRAFSNFFFLSNMANSQHPLSGYWWAGSYIHLNRNSNPQVFLWLNHVRDVPKGEYKKMQPFIRSRKFSPKVSLMEHNLHFCSTRLVTGQQRPLTDQDPLWQIPLNAGTARQREHCFSDPQPIWQSARYTTVHASSDWQRPERIFSLVLKPSSQDIEQN